MSQTGLQAKWPFCHRHHMIGDGFCQTALESGTVAPIRVAQKAAVLSDEDCEYPNVDVMEDLVQLNYPSRYHPQKLQQS